MGTEPQLSWSVLDIDLEQEAQRIVALIRTATARTLHKRGLVVAVSGGIDSSCALGLAVRALGAARVHALLLPEKNSADDSTRRGRLLVEHLGVTSTVEDISPVLEAIGCYRWRDEAVRRVVPDFADDWRMKIAIRGGIEGRYNHFALIVEDPQGRQTEHRLGAREYLQIVAATNFKQRIRKTLEYFHADRLNYAVVGTPNRLEYDQGFFVRNGDGAADIKPIAHLYKSQVYAMARHLGLPDAICNASPTTDTYSLPQSQQEFYFALPWRELDLALWALNHGIPAATLAEVLGIGAGQAGHIYDDIRHKRETTRALHLAPVALDRFPELDPG